MKKTKEKLEHVKLVEEVRTQVLANTGIVPPPFEEKKLSMTKRIEYLKIWLARL